MLPDYFVSIHTNMQKTAQYSEESKFRMVFIPKGFYIEGSVLWYVEMWPILESSLWLQSKTADGKWNQSRSAPYFVHQMVSMISLMLMQMQQVVSDY